MLHDRPHHLVLATFCATALLAGCGGSDDPDPQQPPAATTTAGAATTGAPATTTTAPAPRTTQADGNDTAPSGGDADTDARAHAKAPAVPHPVPAGSSKPAPKLDGSDGSVERFGVEAPAEDATAIAQLVGDFQAAMIETDARRVCELAATNITKPLVQMVRRARPSTRPTCAAALETITRKPPAVLARAMRGTKLLSIRVKGDRGFAIVRQPGVGSGPLAVVRENGVWKVATLAPSVVSPPAAG